MISRKGTRRSGAASGFAKILREDGSGPVVTAGSVLSGLERVFMGSSFVLLSFRTVRSADRSGISKLWSEIPGSLALRAPRNDAGDRPRRVGKGAVCAVPTVFRDCWLNGGHSSAFAL